MKPPEPLALSKLKVHPLEERRSLTRVEDILVVPQSAALPISADVAAAVNLCAAAIRSARECEASVIIIYGAHLLRNGAALILDEMMRHDWVTHLTTNGAGSIHDWEYAWLGRSTENVQDNVATGTFGVWDETGRNIHLALLSGALDGLGYGWSLGRFIFDEGVVIPDSEELRKAIVGEPDHPLTAARADLLRTIVEHKIPTGRLSIRHRWKHASILASAFGHGISATVHPGIGYDIISNHPMFNGAVIGRAGEWDFRLFGGAVEKLDGGVVLSLGSAIMGPQVFEKSLSCVNNLRLQEGRPIVAGHSIYVVDLQDGGNWDWSRGEPPKDNPAYYLRFCKSFSRMGGAMRYLQCDNVAFLHNLYHALCESS